MLKDQAFYTALSHCHIPIPTIKYLASRAVVPVFGRGVRDKLLIVLACTVYFLGRCFPPLLGPATSRLSSTLIRHALLEIGSVTMKIHQVPLLDLGMDYEAQLWQYLLPRPGDVFLDVGANVGWYTLHVARMVGPEGLVLAVEPSPDSFAVLKENIKLNHLSNVTALNLAAWDRDADLDLILATICIADTVKQAWADPAEAWFRKPRGTVRVPARPLDDVLKDQEVTRLDWVKIDVEGAEAEVLRGLRKALMRFHPRILVESERLEDLTSILEPMGYQVLLVPEPASTAPPNYFCYTR